MDYKLRLEVQGATQQWVASFMKNNNIPAAMMEDALNKVLCDLKDKVVTEFLLDMQSRSMNSAIENEEEEE